MRLQPVPYFIMYPFLCTYICYFNISFNLPSFFLPKIINYFFKSSITGGRSSETGLLFLMIDIEFDLHYYNNVLILMSCLYYNWISFHSKWTAYLFMSWWDIFHIIADLYNHRSAVYHCLWCIVCLYILLILCIVGYCSVLTRAFVIWRKSHMKYSELMYSMYYQYNNSFIVGTFLNQQFISCVIFFKK